MPEELQYCVICGNRNIFEDSWAAKRLGLIEPYKVKVCSKCDLKWLSPRPTEQEYKKIYLENEYFTGNKVPQVYEDIVKKRIPYFKKRCLRIKKVIGLQKIKLLDIGAATGEFAKIANEMGIEAIGIEISRWACEIAKEKHNINLICKDLLDCDFPDSYFDVVQMNHVFEHIVNPLNFLKKVKKILKKNGLLVLEVPYQFDNYLEKVKKILGRTKYPKYSLFSIHHPFFYSPKSISLLLNKYNFRILSLKTFDLHNPSLEIDSNFIFGKIIKVAILFTASFFNKGGFIEIFARMEG